MVMVIDGLVRLTSPVGASYAKVNDPARVPLTWMPLPVDRLRVPFWSRTSRPASLVTVRTKPTVSAVPASVLVRSQPAPSWLSM